MKFIYDEVCAWPYHEPYGMVAAPKVKKPRKPRKSRAKTTWLAVLPKKEKERTHGPTRKRRPRRLVVEAPAKVRQTALLEATPQSLEEMFVANRRINVSEYPDFNEWLAWAEGNMEIES